MQLCQPSNTNPDKIRTKLSVFIRKQIEILILFGSEDFNRCSPQNSFYTKYQKNIQIYIKKPTQSFEL